MKDALIYPIAQPLTYLPYPPLCHFLSSLLPSLSPSPPSPFPLSQLPPPFIGMPRPPYPHGRPGQGYVSEVEKSLASESLLLYVGDATPRMPKHSHLLNSYVGGDAGGSSRLAQVSKARQGNLVVRSLFIVLAFYTHYCIPSNPRPLPLLYPHPTLYPPPAAPAPAATTPSPPLFSSVPIRRATGLLPPLPHDTRIRLQTPSPKNRHPLYRCQWSS